MQNGVPAQNVLLKIKLRTAMIISDGLHSSRNMKIRKHLKQI